jgi:hypothetical protein
MKCKGGHVCSVKEKVFSYKLQWHQFTERSEVICQLVLVLNNAIRVVGVWGGEIELHTFLAWARDGGM